MKDDAVQLDLTEFSVTDGHCHLFSVQPTADKLCKSLSMSLNDMPPDQLRHTLVYRRVLQQLGLLFGVQGGENEILSARQEHMQRDYGQYVRELFHDAHVQTLVVDLGYKPASVDLGEFEKLVPGEVLYLYRIEEVVDPLWSQIQAGELHFRQAEKQFYCALHEALAEPRMVGLKSIIGYRTGLDVRPQARLDLTRTPVNEKAFRDFFLLRALEIAAERNLPVQIHAAFGESNIDLLQNNPALLKPLLDMPVVRRCPIVLVHGGYPRSFEAGYLAAVYPNVYVDVSAMVPFVPLGALRGISDIFDMCPLNKITFGSDGYVVPEIHWFGAKMVKDVLVLLLSKMIRQRVVDEDYAQQVATMVLSETARQLYACRV